MLNVKGLDLDDDEDDFANRQYTSFPLRPSVVGAGKGPKKKKKCCGSSTQWACEPTAKSQSNIIKLFLLKYFIWC